MRCSGCGKPVTASKMWLGTAVYCNPKNTPVTCWTKIQDLIARQMKEQ